MDYIKSITNIIRSYGIQNASQIFEDEEIILLKKELPAHTKGIILCDDGIKFSVLNTRLNNIEELEEIVFHVIYHYSHKDKNNYELLHVKNAKPKTDTEIIAKNLVHSYFKITTAKKDKMVIGS